jgi:hypothetical protein
VRVTDNGSPALDDFETISVTVNEVNEPPVLAAIGPKTIPWDETLSFTATASDPDIPANTLVFSLEGTVPSGASITSAGAFSWTPTFSQIGDHTFKVRVTDNGVPALYDEEEITVTVGKRETILVYGGDASGQYSDKVTVSATLTDKISRATLSDKSITFTIGTQSESEDTDGSGVALTHITLDQPAKVYTVDSTFAGDDLYLSSSDSDPFTITKEDARAYYTGALYVSTSSPTSSSATITLSATIKDITAVVGDPAHDEYPGDIRNALVQFIDRDTNTPIGPLVRVGLIDLDDLTTGTVTYNWVVDIGSSDSKDFTIGIIVKGDNGKIYYGRNVSDDNTVVTVSKPLSNFITGGGYIVLSKSTGLKAGDIGTRTNFGFNVKYNKAGKNLQGNINVIIRRTESDGLHVYQIKGNAMTSLSVDPTTGKATFNGKANIKDITDPLNPISVDGNAALQVTMTDKGEPGKEDTISITVWNKSGGLWFSSSWDGTRTQEQVLSGGNLVVH